MFVGLESVTLLLPKPNSSNIRDNFSKGKENIPFIDGIFFKGKLKLVAWFLERTIFEKLNFRKKKKFN